MKGPSAPKEPIPSAGRVLPGDFLDPRQLPEGQLASQESGSAAVLGWPWASQPSTGSAFLSAGQGDWKSQVLLGSLSPPALYDSALSDSHWSASPA